MTSLGCVPMLVRTTLMSSPGLASIAVMLYFIVSLAVISISRGPGSDRGGQRFRRVALDGWRALLGGAERTAAQSSRATNPGNAGRNGGHARGDRQDGRDGTAAGRNGVATGGRPHNRRRCGAPESLLRASRHGGDRVRQDRDDGLRGNRRRPDSDFAGRRRF